MKLRAPATRSPFHEGANTKGKWIGAATTLAREFLLTDVVVVICDRPFKLLAFAGRSLRHDVFAGITDFREMRFHAGLNSAVTRLHVGRNLLDVCAACFRNSRGFYQDGLAGCRDVAKMRSNARLHAPITRLNARAKRFNVPGTCLHSRRLRHSAGCREAHNGAHNKTVF